MQSRVTEKILTGTSKQKLRSAMFVSTAAARIAPGSMVRRTRRSTPAKSSARPVTIWYAVLAAMNRQSNPIGEDSP